MELPPPPSSEEPPTPLVVLDLIRIHQIVPSQAILHLTLDRAAHDPTRTRAPPVAQDQTRTQARQVAHGLTHTLELQVAQGLTRTLEHRVAHDQIHTREHRVGHVILVLQVARTLDLVDQEVVLVAEALQARDLQVLLEDRAIVRQDVLASVLRASKIQMTLVLLSTPPSCFSQLLSSFLQSFSKQLINKL